MGKDRPNSQGIILGLRESFRKLHAIVDTGDVHCLMIGSFKSAGQTQCN